VITDWLGEYFANASLQGSPKVVRNDRVVDLALAAGLAPASGIPSENWSARWSRTWFFQEGNYRFRLRVDDGARLYVGGKLLIDAWADGAEREFTADRFLRGNVPVRLEYYNHLGAARARLNWDEVAQYSGWLGSYYDVPTVSGMPIFQRGDAAIQFEWGTGSPRSDIPADNFSVRWWQLYNIVKAGQYRFRTASDDGVRLWIDGRLAIDGWADGVSTRETVVTLGAGLHDVQLDYYERTGNARVQLTIEAVLATPTATPTRTLAPSPTHTATASPTRTLTPSPTSTSPAPTATPTASNTPTATPITLPTATATVPVVDTPAPTDTAVPTDTPMPTPTRTPVPPRPAISLQPGAGKVGTPFTVLGTGWPSATVINLSLVRALPKAAPSEPVAQVAADDHGRFEIELVIPPDEGWEGLPSATIQAETASPGYRERAVYRLLPKLTKVRFDVIPTTQERFALPKQTYLALGSQEAWAQWFGAEPAPIEPPVEWNREVVLGAFLGPQKAGTKVAVTSVVQRENVVSVWLSAEVPMQAPTTDRSSNNPRVMVRVPRPAPATTDQSSPGIQYAFLDVTGRLLAQGPVGGEPLPMQRATALKVEPMLGAQAVAPEGEAAEGTQEAARAAGAELPEVSAAEGAAAAEAGAELAAAAPDDREAATVTSSGDRLPAATAGIAAGAFILVGWGIGVAVNRRAKRRGLDS